MLITTLMQQYLDSKLHHRILKQANSKTLFQLLQPHKAVSLVDKHTYKSLREEQPYRLKGIQ